MNRLKKWALMSPEEELRVNEQEADVESMANDKKSSVRSCMRFFGPGYLIAVGYMDPGNWATDIGGGAEFQYKLLFVVLLSSLTALMFQILCIKLGVVTRLDLAQQCRRTFPRWLNMTLYALAEVAIIATDLAEVIGSAIALYLLTGLPLIWGVIITVADVLVILKWWGRRYQKIYEVAVFILILIVAACFIAQLTYTKPSALSILDGFVPTSRILTESSMLYLAVAILGATVMPHNIYLHASICQQRKMEDQEYSNKDLIGTDTQQASPLIANATSSEISTPASSVLTMSPTHIVPTHSTKMTLKYSIIDTCVALSFAFLINSTILIVGASAFYDRDTGENDVQELQGAYYALKQYVGPAAATLFAIALLASGQASTVTGTMAGQIIMSGFLRMRLRPFLRRMVTRLLAVLPAILTILLSGEDSFNDLLVLSQVVLSFQLPFAIIPLVFFTSSRRVMGGGASTEEGMTGGQRFVNGWVMTILASFAAAVVTGLNCYLVIAEIIKAVQKS